MTILVAITIARGRHRRCQCRVCGEGSKPGVPGVDVNVVEGVVIGVAKAMVK